MKKRNYLTCLLFIVNITLQGGRPITKEDIVNLKFVSSPTMDPKGENVETKKCLGSVDPPN